MRKLKFLFTSTNEDSSKICNFCVFTFHTATTEEEKVVSGKKSSDISSSMIEIAYNPTLVPIDMDDFEDDFEEILIPLFNLWERVKPHFGSIYLPLI